MRPGRDKPGLGAAEEWVEDPAGMSPQGRTQDRSGLEAQMGTSVGSAELVCWPVIYTLQSAPTEEIVKHNSSCEWPLKLLGK